MKMGYNLGTTFIYIGDNIMGPVWTGAGKLKEQ